MSKSSGRLRRIPALREIVPLISLDELRVGYVENGQSIQYLTRPDLEFPDAAPLLVSMFV